MEFGLNQLVGSVGIFMAFAILFWMVYSENKELKTEK